MIKKDLEHKNIKELLSKVKAGDHSAFEIIIDKYRNLVIHIIFRMVSNSADREDLFQDIFFKVYKNIKHFRFQSKFSTWIGKIAYNTCLNHIKKHRPESIEQSILINSYINPFSDTELLPDDQISLKEITDHVHKEIENLNYIYKTVLTLFHLENMSYKEIGTIMNIPQGSVKSYIFRARKELKKRLLSKFKDKEICKVNI
ncbi:MAG: sigma-70 family RNA polymerase sigma factor [bacterium]